MAPAEPLTEPTLPFVEENLDILAALLGDDLFDESNYQGDEDDFGSVFETMVNEEQAPVCNDVVNPLPLDLDQPHCEVGTQHTIQAQPSLIEAESPTPVKPQVFKSASAKHSKQSVFRQNAIERWMMKRERRVFVRRVVRPNAAARKAVPNRSGANGRFVKSTCGFISITEAQSKSVEFEDDHSCDMVGTN